MWFWVKPAHHNTLNYLETATVCLSIQVLHVVHGCQMSTVYGLLFYIHLQPYRIMVTVYELSNNSS